MRTFVYRLKPTNAQHRALLAILSAQRQLYNAALEERINAWRLQHIAIRFNDQTKSLTQIRSFEPAYGGIPYNISKWTLKRLDDAFRAFFRRHKAGQKPGFPRFRGRSRWNSFGFHQKDGLRIDNTRLLFSNGLTGCLRVKMHRLLPADAIIKSAVFTLRDGIWRVALSCEITAATPAQNAQLLGIDVGVEHLATDSHGQHYPNARIASKRQRDLRRAARALARCRKGSRRRRKIAARLRRVSETIRNARTTHLHQVSRAIVATSPLIAVEKLKLTNMTRSARGTRDEPGTNVRQKAGLNRALADAAPGRLIAMLVYKAESAGGRVIAVDPKGTSQTCSSCNANVPKTLAMRRHICACGVDMHRDHNAAINIQLLGLEAMHEAAMGLGEPNVGRRPVRAPGKTDLQAA